MQNNYSNFENNITHYSKDPNSDLLYNLPTNQISPSAQELSVINKLFSTHGDTTKNLIKEFKNDLFIALLFFVFSLKQIDDLIMKYVPLTQKYPPYFLLIFKSLLFALICWLIKNFWLIKK